MYLRVKRISVRVFTSDGLYGTDLALQDGLNIIQGTNTLGKSTCVMAINYCLGLEGMLGPSRRPPFPYVLSSILESSDGAHHKVVQSYVEIEARNDRAQVIQIRRFVYGGPKGNLVSVQQLDGDSLWPDSNERDFYVNVEGAAKRDLGFHAFLVRFIGWQLPEVPDFDGRRHPLYIETIFPFFFIEQKAGWSAIQGPFPTYLRIQDVARRATEFVLDLNIQRARAKFREIEEEMNGLRRLWNDGRLVLTQLVRTQYGRFSGLPAEPTIEFISTDEALVEVVLADKWLPLGEAISSARQELDGLLAEGIPAANATTALLETQLTEASDKYQSLQIEMQELMSSRNEYRVQLQATTHRLSALREDLVKHRDTRRLKELGSALGSIVSSGLCPTCQQSVEHELLPANATHVMTVDEGIAFIQSQMALFEAAHRSVVARLEEIEADILERTAATNEVRGELRAIRTSLTSPAGTPSAAQLRRQMRLEEQIEAWAGLQEDVDVQRIRLKEIADKYLRALADREASKRIQFDKDDLAKIGDWTREFRRQLSTYDFKSSSADLVQISPDSFRPTMLLPDEGDREREISHSVSASDFIRLKWAYLLSLLALKIDHPTNHLGLLVVDEPGQQEMDSHSSEQFLRTAATIAGQVGQMVIATSAEIQVVRRAIEGTEAQLFSFSDKLLTKIVN